MKALVVIGTRPQIVKSSVLLDALDGFGIENVLVHTGQHYDPRLSEDIFAELGVKHPKYNLDVKSGSYKYQIQTGVHALQSVIALERPDHVITIGDSNPALVGSLGALIHKDIKLAHSEAGLRSGNSKEPEERNRVFVDALSDYLFCSTQECVTNLSYENITGEISLTGDVLYDVWLKYSHRVEAARPSIQLPRAKEFCLFTLHRRSNAYNAFQLKLIVNTIVDNLPLPLVWPVHPGVYKQLQQHGLLETLQNSNKVILIPPTSYLEMRWLEEHCRFVITDSVGIQVESYLAHKPSIILRDACEYRSLILSGWSVQVAPTEREIKELGIYAEQFCNDLPLPHDSFLFGDGQAAVNMIASLT